MRKHRKPDGTLVPFTAEEEAQWDAMEAPPPYSSKELEAAYHALIAASICNLQSQTAWIAAVAFSQPCNPAKIMECKAWGDSLWAQYHVDKAAGLSSPTFDIPQPSYSFMETMTPD